MPITHAIDQDPEIEPFNGSSIISRGSGGCTTRHGRRRYASRTESPVVQLIEAAMMFYFSQVMSSQCCLCGLFRLEKAAENAEEKSKRKLRDKH